MTQFTFILSVSAVASFATKNWIGGVLYVLTTLPSVFLFLGAKDSRKGYMISWLVLHVSFT